MPFERRGPEAILDMKTIQRTILALAVALAGLNARSAEDIDYAALFKAIRQVESDCGKTSANAYQITVAYLADLERITGDTWDYNEVTRSEAKSELAMRTYWAYYSRSLHGRPVTAKWLAQVHRVGLRGITTRKWVAEAYWKRVSKWYSRFRSKRTVKGRVK